MLWNFFQVIFVFLCELFKQTIITQPVPPKSVIVPNYNCVGPEFVYQEVFDIINRILIGKGFCKGNNDKMINTELFQKPDLFFKCIDQPNSQDGRRHYLARMGMKRNDDRLAADGS